MGSSLPLVEVSVKQDATSFSLGGNLGRSSLSLALDSSLYPLLSRSSGHTWGQRSTVCSTTPSRLLPTWTLLHFCRSHCWLGSQREVDSSDPHHVLKAVFIRICMVPDVLCTWRPTQCNPDKTSCPTTTCSSSRLDEAWSCEGKCYCCPRGAAWYLFLPCCRGHPHLQRLNDC